MGKRSTYPRRPRDDYPTPIEAVWPLLPHLKVGTYFFEPCAGDGALVRYLESVGLICAGFTDIVNGDDARTVTLRSDALTECFITNPPWDRPVLHEIIDNLVKQYPTWLLLDAGWMHTKQAGPFMDRLRKIVSVGRVKWVPGSDYTGKDDCAWYLFDDNGDDRPTQFYGRTA